MTSQIENGYSSISCATLKCPLYQTVKTPKTTSDDFGGILCTLVNNKCLVSLRVNVRTIQSGAEQGSVDLADFHICCSVFHTESLGKASFSKIGYCSGLR